jgi:hypothetical protein
MEEGLVDGVQCNSLQVPTAQYGQLRARGKKGKGQVVPKDTEPNAENLPHKDLLHALLPEGPRNSVLIHLLNRVKARLIVDAHSIYKRVNIMKTIQKHTYSYRLQPEVSACSC